MGVTGRSASCGRRSRSGEDLPADAEATSITTRLRAGGKTEYVHIGRPNILLCVLGPCTTHFPCSHTALMLLVGSRDFLLSFCRIYIKVDPLLGLNSSFHQRVTDSHSVAVSATTASIESY